MRDEQLVKRSLESVPEKEFPVKSRYLIEPREDGIVPERLLWLRSSFWRLLLLERDMMFPVKLLLESESVFKC